MSKTSVAKRMVLQLVKKQLLKHCIVDISNKDVAKTFWFYNMSKTSVAKAIGFTTYPKINVARTIGFTTLPTTMVLKSVV